MSTQTLKTIALDVVGQYQQAGQYLATAYQTGVERSARAFDERFAAAVQGPALPLVTDAVKSSLIDAEKQVTGAIAGGLRAGSERVAEFNERVAEGFKSGIERIAAARIDNEQFAKAADAWALLNIPSAQLSLSFATAVADGAKRLSESVASEKAEVVVADVVAAKRAQLAEAA